MRQRQIKFFKNAGEKTQKRGHGNGGHCLTRERQGKSEESREEELKEAHVTRVALF